MRQNILLTGLFTVLPLLWQPAAADGVYTWTDADGVTHFSDSPPAAGQVAADEVETIAMPAGFPEPADPEANYYSIANQWQRLQAERDKKEELALQREQVRVQQRQAEAARHAAARAQAAADVAANEARYVPAWGLPAYRGYPARFARRHGPVYGRGHIDHRAHTRPSKVHHRLGAGRQGLGNVSRGTGLSVSINRPGFQLGIR